MVAEAVKPGKRGAWLRAERLLRSTGIGTVTGRFWPPADGLACTTGFDPDLPLTTVCYRVGQ
jgi:hypothetical protein